ncbi:MAG: helix-turn-helix domain-containing protein [Nocardioides sp.]|nr:helix-turn-helix domain-containing protein [Nocardioides sp.]
MATTVRDLVEAPELALDLVVAGHLDRRIRWVHVTELADPSPYLAGDEFVLTAGVWQGRGTSAHSFVRALHARAVCGVAYGLLDPDEPVPAELVVACREHDLTLAVVPVRTPFVAVSTWFFDRLSEEREAVLRGTLRLTQDLLSVADDDSRPGGDALRQVVRRLANGIGREVSVDAAGVLLARSREGAQAHDVCGPDGDRIEMPVLAEGRPVARLVVHPGRTEPDWSAEADLVTRARIATAVSVVELVFARRRAVKETERRMAGEVVSLVLSRQPELVRARLEVYGLDPDGLLVSYVLAVEHRDTDLSAAERWLRTRGLDGVVALRGDELTVILQPAAGDVDVKGVGAALVTELGGVAAGVGETSLGVDGLRRSVVQARQACTMSRRTGRGGLISHTQGASHALLLALQEPDIVDSFVEHVLGPVRSYDQAHGTALIATLRAFLEQHGSPAEAARVLSVHVNTVRQRLERVERLTGRSLAETGDRVDLWLALQVPNVPVSPRRPQASP